MAKKSNPVITHTEIINLAITAVDARIAEWRDKCPDTPAGFAMFHTATQELQTKRQALKQLYMFETGTEYE